MYYPINEALCKHAHEQNHLISEYVPGSTTESYKKAVDAFCAKCEAAKKDARPGREESLDALADRYSRRLAQWYNDSAANDARHVAWFVAGPSNYNMRAHERWSRREDALRAEWERIQKMENDIRKGAGCPDVILSGDPEAVAMLREKLERMEDQQARMKAVNAYWRKHHTFDGCDAITREEEDQIRSYWARGWYSGIPYPPYELQNNLANIKRTRERLEKLEAEKAKPSDKTSGDGWEYIENTEIMRVQFVFDGKPDAEIRDMLKANGFRWAPSQGAWQRQLTDNGKRAAQSVMRFLSE